MENEYSPPAYIDGNQQQPEHDWCMVDKKEIEQQQLIYIHNIIKDTLYAEFNHCSEKEIKHIVQNMNIEIKYKTITITIKKVKNISSRDIYRTIKTVVKNTLYTCSGLAIIHPLKTKSIIAIVFKLF